MFKELFALAAAAPVLLLVSREGEKLRVNLTRKGKDEDDEKALAISVLAPPEELDRDLPGVLADGLNLKADESTTSVADQVKGQIEASSAKTTKKTTARARKAAKPIKPKVVKMKGPKAKPAKAAAPRKPAAKKAKGAALTPTPALAAVIGDAAPIAFNDAMAKVWAYIKSRDLKEKRQGKPHVRADDAMKGVLGAEHASVADLPTLVKAQFIENAAAAPVPAKAPAKARARKGSSTPPVVTPVITPLLTSEKLAEIAGGSGTAAAQSVEPPPVEAVAQAPEAAERGEPAVAAPAIAAQASDPSTPDLF